MALNSMDIYFVIHRNELASDGPAKLIGGPSDDHRERRVVLDLNNGFMSC